MSELPGVMDLSDVDGVRRLLTAWSQTFDSICDMALEIEGKDDDHNALLKQLQSSMMDMKFKMDRAANITHFNLDL